jgi:hypothetical protein
MKKWREWEGLESGANKTLKYHSRIYRKDIPDDEEKLMTNMINQMNYKKKLREKKKMKSTASILVNMCGRDSEDDDGGDEGAGVPQGEGINMSKGEDGENGAALVRCFEGEEGVGMGGKDEGCSVADEERVVKEFAGAGGDYGITDPVDDYGITNYTASQFDIHERISHFMERVPISLCNQVAENEGDKMEMRMKTTATWVNLLMQHI